MAKAFRKLTMAGLLLAAVLMASGPSQATYTMPPCCQSCVDTWTACLNACGCYGGRYGDPCTNALSACDNQCWVSQGISCPI
jgi:hypothetical protein